MSTSSIYLALGIISGVGAAFFQALSYFFSRRFLTECHAGSQILFSISLVQMGFAALAALPFLLNGPLPPLSKIAGPLLGYTFFFLTAQWILFALLKSTDSSIVAPMLGLKIPILGIISVVFLGDVLPLTAWLAIIICTSAAFLVSPPKGLPEFRIFSVILLICVFYSGADLHIPVLVERLEGISPYPALLGVSFAYVLCGFIGLLSAWRLGAFKIKKAQLYAMPYSISWLTGMCFLFITFSLIGVIFGNMLQSLRGFISVLIGIAISRAGLLHIEARITRRSWLVRGIGAFLMSGAIVLYYLSRF